MIQFFSRDSVTEDGVRLEVSCPTCGYSETTEPRYEKQAVLRARLMAREHTQVIDHEVRISKVEAEMRPDGNKG